MNVKMVTNARRVAAACVIASLASLLCGCASFDSRWKSASQTAPAAHSLEGRWQGIWISDACGHHGELRCIITHKHDDVYLADFDATFWNLFRFGYSIDLKAEPTGPTGYTFSGDSDLGRLLGGNYHYQGTAIVSGDPASDSFNSTYKSGSDFGRFKMERPLTVRTCEP